MKNIGIVTFSFGQRRNAEPNPCNIKLGIDTERACLGLIEVGFKPIIVPQWEVGLYLLDSDLNNTSADCVVSVVSHHRQRGAILTSKEVASQAAITLKENNVQEVIVVANPFLHILECRRLVQAEGLELRPFRMSWIGFDRESDQPWTRGPVPMLVHTIKEKFFSRPDLSLT